MYILKRIIISLHSAVFPHKHFVKILVLYENPFIRQFVANNVFLNLQYQSQAGYLKNLGINCTSGKFNIQQKNANIGKIDPKKAWVN